MFTFQPVSTSDCPQVAFDHLSLSSELRPGHQMPLICYRKINSEGTIFGASQMNFKNVWFSFGFFIECRVVSNPHITRLTLIDKNTTVHAGCAHIASIKGTAFW